MDFHYCPVPNNLLENNGQIQQQLEQNLPDNSAKYVEMLLTAASLMDQKQEESAQSSNNSAMHFAIPISADPLLQQSQEASSQPPDNSAMHVEILLTAASLLEQQQEQQEFQTLLDASAMDFAISMSADPLLQQSEEASPQSPDNSAMHVEFLLTAASLLEQQQEQHELQTLLDDSTMNGGMPLSPNRLLQQQKQLPNFRDNRALHVVIPLGGDSLLQPQEELPNFLDNNAVTVVMPMSADLLLQQQQQQLLKFPENSAMPINANLLLQPQYLPKLPSERRQDQTQSQRQKRIRTKYSPEQILFLESEFDKNPFPDYFRRREIASLFDLTEQCMRTWFQNRRMKQRNALKIKKLETQLGVLQNINHERDHNEIALITNLSEANGLNSTVCDTVTSNCLTTTATNPKNFDPNFETKDSSPMKEGAANIWIGANWPNTTTFTTNQENIDPFSFELNSCDASFDP